MQHNGMCSYTCIFCLLYCLNPLRIPTIFYSVLQILRFQLKDSNASLVLKCYTIVKEFKKRTSGLARYSTFTVHSQTLYVQFNTNICLLLLLERKFLTNCYLTNGVICHDLVKIMCSEPLVGHPHFQKTIFLL